MDLRGAEEMILPPFDKQEVVAQLDRLAGQDIVKQWKADEIEQIWSRGGGYPFNNHILASHEPDEFPHALWECAQMHLDEVDGDSHDHFWALCVLTEFDEHRMPPLLATWWNETNIPDLPGCRKIRVEMVATRLARWDSVRGAYVMDEALRKVLEEALRSNQEPRWRALHRAAYELYRDWAENYPNSPWEVLRDYHQKSLPSETRNPEQEA